MAILKGDPTRTTTLRNQYVAEMKRRFFWVRRQVTRAVGDLDVLGVSRKRKAQANIFNHIVNRFNQEILANQLPPAGAWEFQTDARKLESFQSWITEQVNDPNGPLSVTGTGAPWSSQYVDSAYRRGVVRSYNELHPTRAGETLDFASGRREQFLESSFAQPERMSKLEFLYTRSFEELQGITAAMSQQLQRVLAGGIANGLGPKAIAKQLSDTITGITRQRAMVLARTEIIAAHAEGQLDAFEELGVTGVRAMAEWSTAGDDLVCPMCGPLEGAIMTIQEARGLIPRHPNCRCAWIPANVGERSAKDLARDRAQTAGAVRDSVSAGGPSQAGRWLGQGRSFAGGGPVPTIPPVETFDRTFTQGRRSFSHNPLSDAQRAGMREYQHGIYNSEVGGYTQIQTTLREGRPEAWAVRKGITRETVQPFIDDIDDALRNSVAAEDMTVFRGIRNTAETFGIDDPSDLKAGLQWTDEGYTSTTTSKKVASNKFAEGLNSWDDPRILHISVPEGQSALPMNLIENIGEQEVVLPRGMTFQIDRITGRNIYVSIVS